MLVEDVACTVCGCVCDDLRLTVRGGRITRAERACRLAEPWFLSQGATHRAAAEIDGRAASLEDALDRAAELLAASRAPLFYGLSRSSTPGQRAAVRLADWIGATIDTTASTCHAPSIMAIQEAGESTCSLGEIRHRADLVIYWGANPVKSHPRHFERYALDPVGQFVPGGRADRTLVVVNICDTASSDAADLFVPVEPGGDFDALWTLRCLVQGVAPEPTARSGARLDALKDLAERMKNCRCGVVFFGLGLSLTGIGHRNVEALLWLVRDLNAKTRFHAKRMRVPGDVAGADSVLCWQTGYPFGVNLARGYPRYNPGETTADALLDRGEVDACLMVGSEGVATLSADSREHLQSIPTIVLDHAEVDPLFPPTVRFTTDVYGIHAPGTAYRMDEVPIPLRAVLPREHPTDHEVLDAIRERISDVNA